MSTKPKHFHKSKSHIISRKIATVALLISLSMIFSYIESLLPLNFGIPGVKIGIANVVIVVTLYLFGFKTALTVNILRILLTGLTFTGLFSALYGLFGGILSLTGMWVLKNTKAFSILGVSVFGSFLHIVGQLIAASFVFGNIKVFVYIAPLTITSVLTGIIIGILSSIFIRMYPNHIITKESI